ncbi:MAG: cryptochrome/photolyase family protein [Solirubrobacteraceae bacterium]
MSALLWLRRDLRLHDHPALQAALEASDEVVAVFCLDDRLLHGRHESGARTQFMLECLADLDTSLRERGSGLVVRHGLPERELPALALAVHASSVHFSADAGPFARRCDERVTGALAHAGVQARAHPGVFVVDDLRSIRTSAGDPYTVFTPFHRSWSGCPRRQVLAAPSPLPPLPSGIDAGSLPRLSELALHQEVQDPLPGGERVARQAMRAFLTGPLEGYDAARNALAVEGVSRLSPYLHFGCLSARELEHRLAEGAGPDAFRRQLCWRDFYAQVLIHFPQNARSEHQPRYRGTIRWSHAVERFQAWCGGRTGFPLVDAGMRQLGREGWMHNRARLVVGSFLTKDLGIDWRWGERWFMRWLLDGDEASNNGNWQWIASVGVDPQPAFRRIFNPARQQERFDPEGVYVRRYVPELERVPEEHLGEPWRMPQAIQQQSGCVIGCDYPEPIVDHSQARREALARYRSAG